MSFDKKEANKKAQKIYAEKMKAEGKKNVMYWLTDAQKDLVKDCVKRIKAIDEDERAIVKAEDLRVDVLTPFQIECNIKQSNKAKAFDDLERIIYEIFGKDFLEDKINEYYNHGEGKFDDKFEAKKEVFINLIKDKLRVKPKKAFVEQSTKPNPHVSAF